MIRYATFCESTEFVSLRYFFQKLFVRMEVKVPDMLDFCRIRGIEKGRLHFVCVFLAPLAAKDEAQSWQELLLFEGPYGVIHLMEKPRRTCFASYSAFIAGGTLFLNLALKVFVVLDFLGAPIQPSLVGVIDRKSVV
jgi:hypothetical protein